MIWELSNCFTQLEINLRIYKSELWDFVNLALLSPINFSSETLQAGDRQLCFGRAISLPPSPKRTGFYNMNIRGDLGEGVIEECIYGGVLLKSMIQT